METLTNIIALCVGLLVRLALPIAVTLAAVYFLRKLDAHWQAQAEVERQAHGAEIQKPACYKVKNCPTGKYKSCLGFTSTKPCWQAFRKSNGYLLERCLTCEVFLSAPYQRVAVHV